MGLLPDQFWPMTRHEWDRHERGWREANGQLTDEEKEAAREAQYKRTHDRIVAEIEAANDG